MIERDLDSASAATYDLIVVGGGIHGAALTLEAARRGLAVLLVERGDFGCRTSWHSLRIVHGGLRYLQTLDLARFRESVAERHWLLRHFPDLVVPLSCLMPLYGEGLRRPAVLRMALAANDFLSRRRNEGVRGDRVLPRGRVLTVEETLEWFPGADRNGLRAGALWYDAAVPDSQRLILEMLHWAAAYGARAVNYAEARRLVVEGGSAVGVVTTDLASGTDCEFRAPVVVNGAGPWCRQVARAFDRDVPELFPPSLGFNVLLDRDPLSPAALAVTPRGRSGATYFLHPWKGRILAGTCHARWERSADGEGVPEELVRTFLDDLNAALPGVDLSLDQVSRVHWGLLPARREGSDELAARAVIRHHGDHGGPRGLFSFSGVKFTTARSLAEKVLDRIHAVRGTSTPPVGNAPRPEPTPWPDLAAFEELLSRDEGRAAAHVRRLVQQEAVLHLDDLLLRRTDWGMDPIRGAALAGRVARLIGWDEARIARELDALKSSIA